MVQALSKLDNAVNGKVSNLHRDRSGSADYSAPQPKMNNFTPPKPPRKAPSSSPPNYRKGYASLDELEFVAKRNNHGGYDDEQQGYGGEQGYPYTGTNPAMDHLRSRSPSRQSPYSRQSPARGLEDYYQSPSRGDYARQSPSRGDYSRQSPSRDYRRSPAREYRQSPAREYRQSPTREYRQSPIREFRQSPSRGGNYGDYSRQSPSRGNHTDSEILNSPSQVLYATISADKHKNTATNLKNQHMANSASQTVQSGFRPVSGDRQSRMGSRTSSKENILDEPGYRLKNGSSPAPNMHPQHASRSLDRFVDSDKENKRHGLKARIHVKSPNSFAPERPAAAGRKPYKTTINTANDTIQYRGFTTQNKFQKNTSNGHGKRIDTEHYKVPKNKAPVPTDYLVRRGRRSESENAAYPQSTQEPRNPFQSTSLVRNVERNAVSRHGEYDREGRRIHADRSAERTRAYSGYSTSPDRELSPDRYARPKGGKVHPSSFRSPSTSPTRPPRTRGAAAGEVNIPVRREHSGRRVERTPSTRAAATSRSPIKKIQRVHNEIKGDGKPEREVGSRSNLIGGSKTLTLSRDRGDKSGARGTKTLLVTRNSKKVDEDRLSKFTEYRAGDAKQGGGRPAPEAEETEPGRGVTRRASHSVGERGADPRRESDREIYERERGQSVPPGANIESMRDFYKTSQYRSMYHLPPSPSRPAPVLDRTNKTQTLERSLRRELTGDSLVAGAPGRRLAKTSVSEGELTDDTARQGWNINYQRCP